MKLTRELLEAGRTPRGSFRCSQLRALGVEMPSAPGAFPPSGWLDRLVGKEVTEEAYAEYVRLRIRIPKVPGEHHHQQLEKKFGATPLLFEL